MAGALKVGLRLWLGELIAGKRIVTTQGIITEEMREKALETRRQLHDINQAEKRMEYKKRLEALEKINDPKISIEEKLISTVLPLLAAKLGGGSTPPPNAATNLYNFETQQAEPVQQQLTQPVEFSSEQIQQLITDNPKLIKHSKDFSDEQIKEWLIQQMPNMSQPTIQKVIQEVRTVV